MFFNKKLILVVALTYAILQMLDKPLIQYILSLNGHADKYIPI